MFLNLNTLILRSRNELKSLFKTKSHLSEASFAALIESMLNKRDDQFHGVWRPGRTYRPGDVVIYNSALWEMIPDTKNPDTKNTEICAKCEESPRKDSKIWRSLMVPVEDNDWEVIVAEGVMWAKVFDKIGIGIGRHGTEEAQRERPEARLDVRKLERGRWLLFPEQVEQTQFTLLHYHAETERSYLVTGLSQEAVNWLTDAAKGFVFRKGQTLPDEKQTSSVEATTGQVLMVIQPKRTLGGTELATLGLNVDEPEAMLDITDRQRGQLLFTPDEKRDPALSIVNLAPECEQNYVAIGVGQAESVFVSDASNGFVFRRGGEYGQYRNEKNINQGDFLTLIRQHPTQPRPQVGIGIDAPQARLHIQDSDPAQPQFLQVQILPERFTPPETLSTGDAAPVISLLNQRSMNESTYLTSGLGNQTAGWVTDAENGFIFRQGGQAGIDGNEQQIDRGIPHLSIRKNGFVGIGTEKPTANLDIVNKPGGEPSGRFLFNLDKKVNPALGILNLRPGSKDNYFTIGADNNHAILVTDSQYGFLFKKGYEFGTNDSEIDINQGTTLVSIRPEGTGQLGIGKQPRDYELDINGMMRGFTIYQNTNSTQIGSYKPLEAVLERVRLLQPITFQWNSGTGFQSAGEQIGLLAHEVDDVFPQVVKTDSDGTQAIAYQNLVPVLIKALKELIEQRDETHQNLQTLQDNFRAYQQRTDTQLQQLNDRLRRLEQE
ncbi:tail fiber domain-containing protein [Cyanobacteria bacterium FACHB-63]|nr:tail fiber domain-containing protein [Cyanobacteria bacterium FACHB-63]